MIRLDSPLVLRTALVVVSISTASCGSLGNFILKGHWEDPNAEEVSTAPKSAPTNAVPVEKKVEPPEPALLDFAPETPFTYGVWTLYRNERGMFFWTGKGDSLRLYAVELSKSEVCWTTRRADGPRVMHCLDKHYALLRDLKPEDAKLDGPPSATRDTLNGLPNPPWRNNALTASNLAPGKYDLPDLSGGKKGTFSLEATPTTIKIQLPPAMGERWFVLSNDKTDARFNGELVQLADGCTNADKTLPVYHGMGIQLAKKTCGIEIDTTGFLAEIKVDGIPLKFRIIDEPPNLAARQEDVKKLRKLAAENNGQLDVNVIGDATYTIVTARGKKPKGETFGMVESDRTIGNIHYQCIAQFEGDDVAKLPAAKQLCLSMRAVQ